jgi:hypothetical protein
MQILPDRYPRTLDIVKIIGKGPGFGYPQKGFALLEIPELLKLQISNHKKQINNNDPNSKSQTKKTIDHAAQAPTLRVEPVLNL